MQGASFAQGAARLSGMAARLLGWRPGEFWAATPAELAAILSPDADPVHAAIQPLSREDFNRMMERDHDQL